MSWSVGLSFVMIPQTNSRPNCLTQYLNENPQSNVIAAWSQQGRKSW